MSKKVTTKKAASNNNDKARIAVRNALHKLLKRKDGVSVAEAVDELGVCKKTVRKYMAALNAKPTDYVGYYRC